MAVQDVLSFVVTIRCSLSMTSLCAVQGTHTAMKSGMLAAEAAFNALSATESTSPADLSAYEEELKASWVWEELHAVRNIRPGFAKLGLYGGLAHAAVDTVLLRGEAPWTLRHRCWTGFGVMPRFQLAFNPIRVLTCGELADAVSKTTSHSSQHQPAAVLTIHGLTAR